MNSQLHHILRIPYPFRLVPQLFNLLDFCDELKARKMDHPYAEAAKCLFDGLSEEIIEYVEIQKAIANDKSTLHEQSDKHLDGVLISYRQAEQIDVALKTHGSEGEWRPLRIQLQVLVKQQRIAQMRRVRGEHP